MLNRLEWQREYRRKHGNLHTKVYEKSINGFLMRTYRNMTSRVTGIQHKKAHLYLGKSLLNKTDFYLWSKIDPDFNALFRAWEKSNYSRKLSPSINRIDSKLGYEFGNIEWLTHSQNSGKVNQK